ncbi:MAG: hypothetical protein LBQ70_06365, partial [Prevotellaceae bacterium]|nr:hypothetical protein [Prevotellaceae bacterium]
MRYRIVKRKKKRIIVRIFLLLILIITGYVLYCMYFLPAYPANRNIVDVKRIDLSENFYKAGDSWLLKNKYGLWEMYAEGDAIGRGNKIGILS